MDVVELITQNKLFVLFSLLIIETIVFGWQIFSLKKQIKILSGGVQRSKIDVQNELLGRVGKLEKETNNLKPRVQILEKIAGASIHKVGFMRFNPFKDMGGDNSFVAVFLDGQDNGVIISSLYNRNEMRVFGKPVQAGKTKYPLTQEEKEVLNQTLNKKISLSAPIPTTQEEK